MTKKFTYKYIAQIQRQCREAVNRMDEQVESLAKEGTPAPTDYTIKADILRELFDVHEQIMEQLMDERSRLASELKSKS